jgi:RNA polymerase sigma factor (sigma-70 family)
MDDTPRDSEFWAGLRKRISVLTRGSNDAEDLLHTAYIRLENYRVQHRVDSPAGFLVRTALNLGVDKHRHDNYLSEVGISADTFEIADDAPLQDEVIEARERLHRVELGLARLSPRTREVFLMYRIDGLKYREIAAQLGISESAVAKHIAKAVLFLTEWMEGW